MLIDGPVVTWVDGDGDAMPLGADLALVRLIEMINWSDGSLILTLRVS